MQEKAEAEYDKHIQELEGAYKDIFQDLYDYSTELRNKIKEETEKLQSLEDKQLVYIKEQEQKAKMLAEKDYYRLALSEADEMDVQYLRDLQNRLSRKEAIDKLIWEVYYKSKYDTLMLHLFGTSTNKVSGIYKITCITSGKEYVGQSVDIAERFRAHIKAALAYGPATNKLYQEMKIYKPSDFLFQVLEEVPRAKLNERESYWINFYRTKEYGLNKTSGNS